MLRQAKEVACDGDVYLDGGDIVQQAIAADLVDEFILTLVPALLGEGVRLWGALPNHLPLRFEVSQPFGLTILQARAQRLRDRPETQGVRTP